MTSPYGWLLGLGKGAAGLGDDMNTRGLLEQQKREQQARDALSRLVTLQQIGGTEIQPGTDPRATLAAATQANTMRSGGAIPNAAIGMPDDATPDAYGSPRTVTLPGVDGKPMQILMDPSKTPQASAERRQSLAQAAIDRRAQATQDAITARADQANQAKTLAGVKAARADYNTLKSLDPKHPLVQDPFDADNAANYGDALKFKQSQILQHDAYHPPVSEGDWAPSGAVDKVTGEPILFNKKTGARMNMTGAAPKAGGAGAGGAEDVKKAEQLGLALNSLREVIPEMEARNFQAPNIATGPLGAKAHDKGMGAELAAGALNKIDPGLSELDGAMNLFLSAAAHSVGGARISPEQTAMFTSGYKARTGDSPDLVQKKLHRAVDFLNAAAAVLPPDMVAKQHAALGPEALKTLGRYGYGQQPSASAMAAVQDLQSSTGAAPSSGTPNTPVVQPGGKVPTYEEWKKKNGIP